MFDDMPGDGRGLPRCDQAALTLWRRAQQAAEDTASALADVGEWNRVRDAPTEAQAMLDAMNAAAQGPGGSGRTWVFADNADVVRPV